MELFWLIGLVILLVVFIFDRKVLAFDLPFFKHWFKIITISSAIAIVVRFILGVTPHTPDLSFGTLLLVGWEDLFFSVLLIYYPQKYLHRYIATPLAIISSLLFASGHLYQGTLWAAITVIYPYFISYRVGRKYGYGTAMALHATYDISVSLVPVILGVLYAI